MIKSIPLASLAVSERNVRRTSDPEADAALAADIAAHGLLQNLVVTPFKAGSKNRGSYLVEAGGRRLRALQSLVADGTLPEDLKVPCLVLGKTSETHAATEASLAENLQRLAMNPADECAAFGTLIEQGGDVEGIARRFGLTVRHVEGRLRLAGLHPTVFAALGAGEITLDAARAYAATSDQERQLHVFEQLSGGWSGAHPDSIRRMMIHATVPASDRRLRFVGEEAYLAAGGRLERDLFESDDEARVLDVAILESLATDKLEVEAAYLANEHGYAFVRASLDACVQPWRHEDVARAAIELPGPGDGEREQVEALEAEIDRVAQEVEDLLEDEYADETARQQAEARIAELEAQLRSIAHRPPVLDPETRGTVGFFLLLDEDGVPRLDRTPYVLIGEEAGDEDGAAAGNGADHAGQGDGLGSAGSGGDGTAGPAGTAAGSDASGSKPATPKLAQRLVEELAMQRRDILALHVAGDPDLAFDLAVFLMIRDEGGYTFEGSGSSLTARAPCDPVMRSAMPEAPVQASLAQASDRLDRSWANRDTLTGKFEAFRALPRATREAWLGAAVARTLEASVGTGTSASGRPSGRVCPFHDHLGTLLGIDVARYWRPTALNWFDRVPKALCLAALEEIGGPELAARHAKAKKADIAEACEKLFAGEGIVEAEVKAAAVAWVPEPMRFVADESAAEAGEGEGEGDPAGDPSPPWENGAIDGVEHVETVTIVDGVRDADADGNDDGDGDDQGAPEADAADEDPGLDRAA